MISSDDHFLMIKKVSTISSTCPLMCCTECRYNTSYGDERSHCIFCIIEDMVNEVEGNVPG